MKGFRLPIKTFTLLALFSLLFLACSSDDDSHSRTSFFNFTPDYYTDRELLENTKDSLKIDIETNSYWKIEKESKTKTDWISYKPGKGTGNGQVKIDVEENTTVGMRAAWLYFEAFEYKDSLKVIQKGEDLALSQKMFDHIPVEGKKLTLNLEAVNDWVSEKAEDASWLSLDPTEGKEGKHKLSLAVAENKADTIRMDSIAFMNAGDDNGSKIWLKVSQDGIKTEKPSIKLDSSRINVEPQAGSIDVKLTTNINWSASTEEEEVKISPSEGEKKDKAQDITISYPENTSSESRTLKVKFKGEKPNDSIAETIEIQQLGVSSTEIKVKKKDIDIDGTNQVFVIELSSSNVDWKVVSKDSRFKVIENKEGKATSSPVKIKVNASKNKTYQTITGTLEIQKTDDPDTKTEIIVNQGLHPLNDEKMVYDNPSETAAQLGLDRGVPHPKVEGWKFWNAQEFTDGAQGFWNFNTKGGIKHAVFNDDMKVLKNGTLKIKTRKLAEPTKNIHGDPAKYETAPLYSKRHDQGGVKWVKFTTNMRVEVRYRTSATPGFNEALWFMGQSNYDSQKIPWPECGEIDLMESPYKNESHFTLHTKNFSSETNNPETANVELADATKWNIYWVEILDDKIIGGVNGYQYFEHKKGENGNNDWPWDNPAGMMMVISPGIGGWTGQMPNMSAGEEAFMELDWIRVYTNNKFDESSQKGHDGKFY